MTAPTVRAWHRLRWAFRSDREALETAGLAEVSPFTTDQLPSVVLLVNDLRRLGHTVWIERLSGGAYSRLMEPVLAPVARDRGPDSVGAGQRVVARA